MSDLYLTVAQKAAWPVDDFVHVFEKKIVLQDDLQMIFAPVPDFPQNDDFAQMPLKN
jgi:hypothetical protein